MRGRGTAASVSALAFAASVAGCQLLLDFRTGAAGTNADGGTASVGDDAALATSDAANHALRCDPRKPFAPPVALDAINTSADETCARATEDESTILFDRAGVLMVASRASSSASVRAVVTTPGFPAPAGRAFARGNQLIFDSLGKLYSAPFALTPPAAAGASPMDALNAPDPATTQSDAWVAASGAFYFVRASNDVPAIVVAPNAGSSATPVSLPDAATDAPVLSQDEQTLYYAAVTQSGASIVRATRIPGGGFGNREPVVWPDSAGYAEYPRWISVDECVLYLLRRGGTAGSGDIFRAERPR